MLPSNHRTLFSPAKVNLGLKIVGRRASDGYHLLSSVFWPLDFGDTLRLSVANENSVTTTWAETAPFAQTTLPTSENNIVSKLLKMLELKIPERFHIEIEKQIPMGGGLGGGSSNAGSILKWLISEGKIAAREAEELALALGADVPFFLKALPSLVGGIGEKISPLDLQQEVAKRLRFVLLLLPVHSNTRNVFEEFARCQVPVRDTLPVEWVNGKKVTFEALVQFLRVASNDLEPIVTKLHPLVGQSLEFLRSKEPLFAAMSGSGSTCVALYDSLGSQPFNPQVLNEFCRKNGCRSITAHSAAR